MQNSRAFCNSARGSLRMIVYLLVSRRDNFFSRQSGWASVEVSKGEVSSMLARASKIHALATNLFRPGVLLVSLRRRSLATSLLIQPRAFSLRLKNIYVLFQPNKCHQPDGSMPRWMEYEYESEILNRNIVYLIKNYFFKGNRKIKYNYAM